MWTTIVLPYFDMIERLIGYARDVTEDRATMRDTFYQNFVLNPVAALSDFGPRQILFVRSAGDDSPGAPGLDDTPGGLDREIAGRRTEEEGLEWKLVGRGAISGPGEEEAPTLIRGSVVATIPDSIGIAIPISKVGAGFWLLSPFIDPAIKRQHHLFKAALLRALNHGERPKAQIKKKDFDAWLDDVANRKGLLLNRVNELRTAYETVEGNVNISSMCLYSGPLPDGKERPKSHSGSFGKWNCFLEHEIGWLATGDADLKVQKRRHAFLRHYHTLLPEVGTLTIPHHGSEKNFHSEVVTQVDPSFCIAAADEVGRWRHPGTKVVQAIASHGRFLSVVTSKKCSEVKEEVMID